MRFKNGDGIGMIKVFLVEDEIVMREGIKNNIDWEREGFEFVGEASDGELAYPLIQKARPDILITDIKMPFMDGLELSRLVKQEMPDIKIIILSGYDEFAYAKEAIKIGITDYLVKPIAGAKLSAKPVDKEHPFGHGRLEYISALAVSGLILLMGFELAKSSLEKIINPEPLKFSR